jgi:hypothetical protein
MSTLKATNLQSPSAVNPAIVLAADGSATAQISSINNGPLAGFRNAIINGNFDIWQRGTSFTGNEYGADRWVSGRTGTTHTATQQPFTLGQTDVPNNPTYYIRTVVSSVAGASNNAYLTQLIEGVRTFSGQQVTVSFWAKVDTTKNISVELIQSFGTGGSPSAAVSAIGATKVSIGTGWQKVTVTANVPSISGKTLGTGNNDYLALLIWFDAGSDFNARTDSLGQQSGTFEIAQVQVERGPVATPFEQRPIGTELALCQRYYELLPPVSVQFPWASATQVVATNVAFKVTKRATPVVALTGVAGSTGTATLTSTTPYVDGALFGFSGNAQNYLTYTGGSASIEL